MQYWDDMRSKYGFGDGDHTPVGIRKYRTVYLRVVNELLLHRGSCVRYVPYNRPGLHNDCLVIPVSDKWLRDNPDELLLGQLPPAAAREVTEDVEHDSALGWAYELHPDHCLLVAVEVDHPSLDSMLKNLGKDAE